MNGVRWWDEEPRAPIINTTDLSPVEIFDVSLSGDSVVFCDTFLRDGDSNTDCLVQCLEFGYGGESGGTPESACGLPRPTSQPLEPADASRGDSGVLWAGDLCAARTPNRSKHNSPWLGGRNPRESLDE